MLRTRGFSEIPTRNKVLLSKQCTNVRIWVINLFFTCNRQLHLSPVSASDNPKLQWETYNHRNQLLRTVNIPQMWNITNLLSGMCRVNNIWGWPWWMRTRHGYSHCNISVQNVSPRLTFDFNYVMNTLHYMRHKHANYKLQNMQPRTNCVDCVSQRL